LSLLTPLIEPIELRRRSAIVDEFTQHAFREGVDIEQLYAAPGLMTEALRLFGQHLWQNRRSRGDYVRLVNAIRDRKPEWSHSLRAAWDVDRKWQVEEPVTHRTPLPASTFRAAFVIALLFGFIPFAATLLLGFLGGLRPGELLRIIRRTILLPSDLGADDQIIFVVIEKPKTRKRSAATQHVIIDEA
jgi:hypothetical protein